VCLLVGTTFTACIDIAFTEYNYTVEYFCEIGGYIVGDLQQTVVEGDDCSSVIAVAYEGYEFIGWSDGVETNERIDLNITDNIAVTARFKKIETFTVEYSAQQGGYLCGAQKQTVESGADAETVIAFADNGYRFIGWSDGVVTSTRADCDITQSFTAEAQFEKIYVDFYSDGYLVRKIPLVDFDQIDLDSVVGYKSDSKFTYWSFLQKDGSRGTFSADYDALDYIVNIYFNYSISDTDDLILKANYEIVDEGSVPQNSITIAHALGGVDEKSYLNSKEAFELNYSKGFRFFETDVALTTDGIVVCDHNRGTYTYEEFMDQAEEGFTPLALTDLFEYMSLYSDIWLDIDTLGFTDQTEYNLFADFLLEYFEMNGDELLSRIIVEITPYNLELKDILQSKVGIVNFLYTQWVDTNDLSEFEEICQFCYDNGFAFVSVPCNKFYVYGEEKIRLLKEYDIYIMAYTTDDPITMYELFDMGVDCIFTNFSYM
jgi:glycerophosphoryl diester phosphodiesterase